MQHRTLDDLQKMATTLPIHAPMSRRERLERWASLLEQDPNRRVTLLRQVEYLSAGVRAAVRADNSPLTLAFADPVLRGEGLAGDQFGDAETFFGLSWRGIHALVCDCTYGSSATAGQVASRIRSVARRPTLGERWDALRGVCARLFAARLA